jgi:hypothetical protein
MRSARGGSAGVRDTATLSGAQPGDPLKLGRHSRTLAQARQDTHGVSLSLAGQRYSCSGIKGLFPPREGMSPAGEDARLSGERALEGGLICRPAVCCEYDLDRQVEQRAQPLCDLLKRHALG